MQNTFVRNFTVAMGLMEGAIALVVLETRFLQSPPSGFWFFAMVALALVGFVWANLRAFPAFNSSYRTLFVGAIGVVVWLVAVLVVVTVGVNIKFALGGHV